MSAEFHPANPPMLYQGEGGVTKTVRGIDFWTTGRPSRLNRELGDVAVTVAALKVGQAAQLSDSELETIIEEKAAASAIEAHANAAILTRSSRKSDGASIWAYRVVAYLPEGTVADGPIRQDRTTRDADGKIVANGLEVPIKTLKVPSTGKYNVNLIAGTVLVNFCVGVDGTLTTASIVVSSGSKELDAIALRAVHEAKFAPATVLGRPVASCKDLRETWGPK